MLTYQLKVREDFAGAIGEIHVMDETGTRLNGKLRWREVPFIDEKTILQVALSPPRAE